MTICHKTLTYLIHSRIRMINKGHLCSRCAEDATIQCTIYEVLTNDNIEKTRKEAVSHLTDAAIFQATLKEQQQGLPQEHACFYSCISCMLGYFSLLLGASESRRILLKYLRPSLTLWIVRDTHQPACYLFLQAFSADIAQVVDTLQRPDTIPHIDA